MPIKSNLSIDDMRKENSELLDQFATASEKNETVEVLKELFDLSKLSLITDLKPDHISLITRMLIISDLKSIPQWNKGINTFMKLRISKNRQSRTELIKAISGLIQQKRKFTDALFNRDI
jgi:hypothetical protein